MTKQRNRLEKGQTGQEENNAEREKERKGKDYTVVNETEDNLMHRFEGAKQREKSKIYSSKSKGKIELFSNKTLFLNL